MSEKVYATIGADVSVRRDAVFARDCAEQEGGFGHPAAPGYVPVVTNVSEEQLTPDLNIETE